MTRQSAVLCILFVATTAHATTPEMQQRIDMRLSEIESRLVEIRRDLHQNAEAAGNEVHTAETVAKFLNELGLEVTTQVGGHGVVALLKGAQPGETVAYRADMDAMATPAADPESFRSTDPNVNHVCGHDIHTTVALGIAAALAPEAENIAGTIKFIFQPAEEVGQGAAAMIADGVLENPTPDAYFALHCGPMPSGTMFATSGLTLPGIELVEIRIQGSGDLEDTAQNVAAAIQSITTVPQPTSTEIAAMLVPHDKSYAVGGVIGAEPDPESGALVLTAFLKATDEATYADARERLAAALVPLNSYKTQVEAAFELPGLPPMINHPELCASSLVSARAVLGAENVPVAEGSIPFFGEDFSFFQQQAPGMMYFLGVANKAKGMDGMPHSPTFQADEAAIAVGARTMSAVLLDWLGGAGRQEPESR